MLLHLVASALLAGLGWTVQLVVYPAFRLVGQAEWGAYHRRHTRAITVVVGPLWALQAVSLVGLALHPGDVGWPAVLGLGALATVAVIITVAVAIPAHGRLGHAVDDRSVTVLLRANLVRALAWTGSTLLAAILLA